MRKVLIFVLVILSAGALAQTGGGQTLPLQVRPTAGAALEEARVLAAEARAAGERPYPDAPLWAEAIRLGREALRAAPGDPEVLRFLAETYSATNWYAPAWRAWQDLASVTTLDPAALEAGTAAGNQLAYLRYDGGDRAGALSLYQEVIAFNPSGPQAYRWAGRILLEQGQAEAALPFWQEAVRLEPGNEGNRYFLELAEDEVRYGSSGTENFYAGIAAYEAGNLAEALARFQEAARANADYKQAFVWAGRTALELNQPELAAGYWERVLDLDPEDERARYFLEASQDQARWGGAASSFFQRGRAALRRRGGGGGRVGVLDRHAALPRLRGGLGLARPDAVRDGELYPGRALLRAGERARAEQRDLPLLLRRGDAPRGRLGAR